MSPMLKVHSEPDASINYAFNRGQKISEGWMQENEH